MIISSSIAQRKRRITTAITTLDYYMLSISLHAAHDTGYKERGTNVIAANVSRHGAQPQNTTINNKEVQ